MVDMNDRVVQNTAKQNKNEEGPSPLEIISEIQAQRVPSDGTTA
jgi:hypothetical protein